MNIKTYCILTILIASIFQSSLAQNLSYNSTNDIYNFILNQKKSILFIGENDHEEKNTQKLKSEIVIKAFSEQQTDFLVFESDYGESIALYLTNKYLLDTVDGLKAISKIWHSEFTRKMFDTLAFNKTKLNFLGMDILPNSQIFNNWIYSELKRMKYPRLETLDTINKLIIQKTWSNNISVEQSEHYKKNYDEVIEFISKKNNFYSEFEMNLIIHALEGRKKLVKYINLRKPDRFRYRDSCMASNLVWLDSMLLSQKNILIWAHNGHIAYKEYDEFIPFVKNLIPAGSLMPNKIKDRSVNICISAPNYSLKNNYQNPSMEFPKNSIEDIYKGKYFYTILDLKQLPDKTKHAKKTNFTIGKTKSPIQDQFDFMIILNEAYY